MAARKRPTPKRSRQPRASLKKKTPESGYLTIKPQLIMSEDISSYYANYIEVASAQHDFSLYFCHIPARFSGEKLELARTSGVLSMEPDFKVTVPPTVIPGLIRALEKQRKSHEAIFGSIPEKKQGGQDDE